MQRYFPRLHLTLRSWERPVSVATTAVAARGCVRIAVIGAIGVHKGFQVLRACAGDAANRGLPLEFVVVGYSADDEGLMQTGNVFVTGRYDESEIAGLLRREQPHLVLFPSILP